MTDGATTTLIAGATVSALILSFVAGGIRGPVILGLAGLVLWVLSWYSSRTLGGITGDVYGATAELLETFVLGSLALWGP